MESYFEKLRNPKFCAGELSDDLKISEAGNFATYYAPFEHVNEKAKVVICGITPGKKQAEIAIKAAACALADGKGAREALREAKETASFAGRMRANLTEMLDHIGLQERLGIQTTRRLFEDRKDLVHYTSALRNPVLNAGNNFSGGSAMVRDPYLWDQIRDGLNEELQQLSQDIVIVPLGGSVEAVFERMADEGLVEPERILNGLPHPSGANAERIAYFCGRKDRGDLSLKTNADVIDLKRDRLVTKVAQV